MRYLALAALPVVLVLNGCNITVSTPEPIGPTIVYPTSDSTSAQDTNTTETSNNESSAQNSNTTETPNNGSSAQNSNTTETSNNNSTTQNTNTTETSNNGSTTQNSNTNEGDLPTGGNTDPVDSSTAMVSSPIADDAVFSNGQVSVTGKQLNELEAVLSSDPLMQSVKQSIATLDNALVEKIDAGKSSNPSNVKRVERIISAADWEYMFPKRAPEYTYRGYLQAVGKFPAFCGEYDDGRDADAICRKNLATMFAHFTQETGGHTNHWDVPQWRQALVHVREMGWNETMRGGYNGECDPNVWQGQAWPCGTFENGEFKSYFGRGAKQLSYNYNYGPFSEAMFGDVSVLLNQPELVADTWLNLASAIFFYVYPQPPKPSMLHIVDGTWQPNDRDKSNGLLPGFGVTTQVINGGVECGGSTEHLQSQNRIDYYYEFAAYLGVPIASSEVMGCQGMKQFDDGGAGALPIYWEQDWSWNPNTADGESYKCQLVGYQTPFSVFKAGDFGKCVQHYFNLVEVKTDGF